MRRTLLLCAVVLLIPTFAWALGGATDPTYVYNQARHFVAVSPSDTVDLTAVTKGVFVAGTNAGAACVLVAIGADDTSSVTFSNLQPGSDHPYALKRILSTSTTCVGILALY